MFWPDVIDLQLFYKSSLGRVAESVIARSIHKRWHNLREETILGIGFTQPYLSPFRIPENKVFALMPATQGALHWPVDGEQNLTFLADESEIPLPNESVTHVLLVHALENTEQRRYMMREIWRILAPGGKIMCLVPNRNGAWARSPVSPFANGSPYSIAQVRSLLKEHSFSPYYSEHLLFTPPTYADWIQRCSPAIEVMCKRFATPLGGLILIEAEKQIYAPSSKPKAQRKREYTIAPQAQPALSRGASG